MPNHTNGVKRRFSYRRCTEKIFLLMSVTVSRARVVGHNKTKIMERTMAAKKAAKKTAKKAAKKVAKKAKKK